MTVHTQTPDTAPTRPTPVDAGRAADAWQRRFGVPWEGVERAVRAVSDRAVAASRRKFSMQAAAESETG